MTFKKKLAFLLFAGLLSLFLIDVLSAYVLFFYQKAFIVKNIWGPRNWHTVVYSEGPTPMFSIVKTVIEKIEGKLQARREGARPHDSHSTPFKVLFMKDAELGWAAAPGSYEFLMGRPQDTFQD